MTTKNPSAVRDVAAQSWNYRLTTRNRGLVPITWVETVALDGSPLLSGRLEGPGAADALLRFVQEGPLVLSDENGPCQQPGFDLTVRGRVVCVWQHGGVWVELWHPETPTPQPTPPVPAPGPPQAHTAPGRTLVAASTPSERLPLGQRLTHIRRTITTKEN